MVVMFKMSPEKKEKFTKKLDKMMDFLEEFKECLEESEDYDEDWDSDVEYRNMRRRGNSGTSSMRSRYSRRGGGGEY